MVLPETFKPSEYVTISTINEPHRVFLTQHRDPDYICVKKELALYNLSVYRYLLDHPIPGIPKIYGLSEDDNILTVYEEYISGITLEDRLADPSVITETEASSLLNSLCDVVSQLHKCNPPIVHRDIKPSNIIISGHNQVYLIDYNAAKYYDSSTSEDTTLLGTKGYAAPEQYGFGSSSPLTDIYAIGMIIKQITKHTPNLSSNYSTVSERCLQLDPHNRYKSVPALITAINNKRENLTPPGFRTKKIWKMIIAVPIYIFVLYFSATITYPNFSYAAQPIERFITGAWLVGMILFSCNYLDVQRFFPPCKHRFLPLRALGILFWCFVYTILIIILFGIVEYGVFNRSIS